MTETRRRLDQWLWYARFVKSRATATRLCETGRIRVNGTVTEKPHYTVRAGDVLTFALDSRVCVVRILHLGDRRGPAREAQTLYQSLDAGRPLSRGGADGTLADANATPHADVETAGL